MENLLCPPQKKTFFEILQNTPELDFRDKRGQRHELCVVLVGFSLALLCKRDGNLSSIHRHMANHYLKLCQTLGIVPQKVVSRSQLPLILGGVNLPVFAALVFGFLGLDLSAAEKQWFSVDGKELRGSIRKGDKRGEAIVALVGHKNGQTQGQTFYNGKKDSERPAVRDLLKEYHVLDQKISMDALHFIPTTLQDIHQAGGIYMVSLKENQEEMCAEMNWAAKQFRVDYQEVTAEKGHGRLEKRTYQSWDVGGAYFDERWKNCGLSTLIKVNRSRTDCKTQHHAEEVALYMTNSQMSGPKQATECFSAIRAHWAVETVNHVRDVSLSEDDFRTKKTKSQKSLLPLEH